MPGWKTFDQQRRVRAVFLPSPWAKFRADKHEICCITPWSRAPDIAEAVNSAFHRVQPDACYPRTVQNNGIPTVGPSWSLRTPVGVFWLNEHNSEASCLAYCPATQSGPESTMRVAADGCRIPRLRFCKHTELGSALACIRSHNSYCSRAKARAMKRPKRCFRISSASSLVRT